MTHEAPRPNTTDALPGATPRVAGGAPWVTPRVVDLPRLANLTLQTSGGIPGDCPGDPGSCF